MNRNHLKFKFNLNLNEFANYEKILKIENGFSILPIGLEPNPC
jgi:hypothetical protein